MRKIRIDPYAYLAGALLLLIIPFKWLLSSLAAAIIHEIGHILAIRLTGGKIAGITIHPGGAEIETAPMSRTQELVCALAGPVSGLLLLLFVRWAPLIALCGFIQSVYNLLPIYPLDGGRVIRRALELIFPESIACRIYAWAEIACLAGLIILGIYASIILHFGIFPILILFIPGAKILARKIPCKSRSLRVQ